MPRKAASFEDKLQELETLVEQMESGELKLEDALKHFEKGVGLARACQDALNKAEQRVEILLQQSADAEPEPFDPEDAAKAKP